MYPYIISFMLAYFLLKKGNINFNHNKKSFIYDILAICVLSYLASIRDLSIGTDLKLYVKPVFDLSRTYGFSNMQNIWYNVEIGYKVFNCIISMFTPNFSTYLFIQQFFILFFALLGIKGIYKKDYSFAYIIYILLFYNTSLNIVRQSMSLSLSIYALKFLLEDKKTKFILLIIIAFFFHQSAIFMLIAFLLYKLYKFSKNNIFTISSILVFCGLIFVMFFSEILKFITSLGLLSSNYLYYLDNYVQTNLDFSIIEISIDLFFVIIYILFSKKYKSINKESSMYFLFLIIDLILLMISSKYTGVYRVGIYFRIPAIIYFLTNFYIIFKDGKIFRIISLIIAIIIWILLFVVGNSGNTIPFVVNNGLL